MQLYDQDGVLVNSTTPTEYDGSHSAQNLPEHFPEQGPVSGLWKVCTEKPDGFAGTAAIDVLFINVVNEGNIQFAATSSQQVNEDCKVDDNTMCLQKSNDSGPTSACVTPRPLPLAWPKSDPSTASQERSLMSLPASR